MVDSSYDGRPYLTLNELSGRFMEDRKRLMRHISRRGIPECDSEDVLHDAFLLIYNDSIKGRKFFTDAVAPLFGWYIRNSCIQYNRRRLNPRDYKPLLISLEDVDESSLSSMEYPPLEMDKPDFLNLFSSDSEINRRDLDMLALKLFDGLEGKEIARIYKISPAAVCQAIDKLKRRIRVILSKIV